MAEPGNSFHERSYPRPVVTVQKAFVTHGKRIPVHVVRATAARVIPRIVLADGQAAPNLRRGGIVRESCGEASFERWAPAKEPIAA